MFMQVFYKIVKLRFLSELHFIYEENIKTVDITLRDKMKDEYHKKRKEKRKQT